MPTHSRFENLSSGTRVRRKAFFPVSSADQEGTWITFWVLHHYLISPKHNYHTSSPECYSACYIYTSDNLLPYQLTYQMCPIACMIYMQICYITFLLCHTDTIHSKYSLLSMELEEMSLRYRIYTFHSGWCPHGTAYIQIHRSVRMNEPDRRNMQIILVLIRQHDRRYFARTCGKPYCYMYQWGTAYSSARWKQMYPNGVKNDYRPCCHRDTNQESTKCNDSHFQSNQGAFTAGGFTLISVALRWTS